MEIFHASAFLHLLLQDQFFKVLKLSLYNVAKKKALFSDNFFQIQEYQELSHFLLCAQYTQDATVCPHFKSTYSFPVRRLNDSHCGIQEDEEHQRPKEFQFWYLDERVVLPCNH